MSTENDEPDQDTVLPFHEMGIDDRLLKAVAKLGWQDPTPIQERAIPLALEGRDLLVRGRTGSGKTGAFSLPLIQKVLDAKKQCQSQSVRALVLAPTRELSQQIHGVLVELASSCGRRVVRCVDLSGQDVAASGPLLRGDVPDVVVGTPSKVLANMEAGHLDVSGSLEVLVMDEADLIVSFGHEPDVRRILQKLPSAYQTILASATLNDEVMKLKGLALHNPVTLKLEEASLPEDCQLTQYALKVEEEDKFVLIYALFKLRLVRGKTLVFVNTVDRCYKLKLFLEQFSVPVCVLNSELPQATRCHIVSQFNKGIYEVIVASDEKFLLEKESRKGPEASGSSRRRKDQESGASRGIDFQFVANVVNFDFPADADSYIHRVGRTARGNCKGTALSLVARKELARFEEVEKALALFLHDGDGKVFVPYQFRMDELDGFRYRAQDALRSVTRIAVREARLKEIKQEILNSVRLQSHLVDNPKDALLLRHDKALHTVKHQAHLKCVPDYIVPANLRKVKQQRSFNLQKRRKYPDASFVRSPESSNRVTATKRKFQKKQSDPLRALINMKARSSRK